MAPPVLESVSAVGTSGGDVVISGHGMGASDDTVCAPRAVRIGTHVSHPLSPRGFQMCASHHAMLELLTSMTWPLHPAVIVAAESAFFRCLMRMPADVSVWVYCMQVAVALSGKAVPGVTVVVPTMELRVPVPPG
jgi:hypothetical protein